MAGRSHYLRSNTEFFNKIGQQKTFTLNKKGDPKAAALMILPK